MNVGNWSSVFILSLLAITALGYGANRLTRRATDLWNVMSLAFAGLLCATIVATLSPYAPTITTAARAAAAQSLTCVGTPPLVRAGDEIAVTGVAPADSAITLLQGNETLATTTADASGAFAATITLSAPGLQNVNCQVAAGGQTNTILLSFLVIGQAAAPEPLPTNTPEPTATNTTEPTATETPTVAPPVVDTASIPEQLLPGDTFRLRGTAEGGARVRVAVNNRVVAGAVAGPQGSWRTTVGFARSGEYTLTVQLVQDDAVVAETAPIFLTVLEPTPTPEPTATDTPEPTATNTPEPTATDTPEPTATNTPTPAAPVVDAASIPEQLLPGDTFRLRGTADGGARVRVAVNNRVVAGAVAGPQGSWRTTVGFARSGEYTLTVQLVQDDAVVAESEPIFLTVLEPTPTATNTPEPTATNTPEPTATDTPEPTATDTPQPTATNTPEPTATDTPEPTATNTPEPTATDTPEPTATDTPEPTATNTPEPTATNTPTPAAPLVDAASIPEQLLPGDTFRLRGTADGGARVRVAVNNRVVAGAVAGPQGSWRTTVGFARSGEYTLTVQLVQDDAVVAESEPIFLTVLEPTPTATNTPEPTATNTPEPTATDTPQPTATDTPAPTATNTPEPTATDTPEPTATDTPEPTATNTPEPTATNTPTPAAPVVDAASIPEQLLPGDTFRLRGTADGGARVRVAVNNRVVAGAVAGPQGSWRTTVGFARSGEYTLTVQLVQDDVAVAESEPIFVTVLEPTPTPEPTATNTPEPTATNTPEPTATNTPAPTATPVPTPTNTPEPTATPTPEPTATNTPEPTATNTPEPTATNTPTPAAPVVDTASIPDQLLPGDTFRLRGTADGGARVRVAVNNRVVAGAVAGPQGSWRTTVGFARSGEYTLTVQLVQDDVAVAESEPIFVTVLEPTPTPEPTATNTPEPTATNTPEPTATNTPEPTATNTPEPTATNTPEPTATNTPEPTATNTPEPTATNTPEPTATNTPEPTATNTVEPTATETPTAAAPVVDLGSIPEQLLPGDTFRLRGTADGGARVQVAVNNRIVAGAVAGPQGSWRTTIGFARAGTYTLTVQVLQNEAVAAQTEPIFLTVLEPTPTTEPTPTAVLEPTATAAAPVDSSQTISGTAPVDSSQPVTTTTAPSDLPGTGSDFSGGVPWVVLILLLGAAVTLGMGRLSNKPTA